VFRFVCLLVWLLLCGSCAQWEPILQTDVELDVVLGVLEERCGSCHGVVNQFGGVVLPDYVLIDIASGAGELVVPGDPQASRLAVVIGGTREEATMPPGLRLAPGEIQVIVDWIEHGASIDF
jgi:hypothetical protein